MFSKSKLLIDLSEKKMLQILILMNMLLIINEHNYPFEEYEKDVKEQLKNMR